jgi:hypothetical protein
MKLAFHELLSEFLQWKRDNNMTEKLPSLYIIVTKIAFYQLELGASRKCAHLKI